MYKSSDSTNGLFQPFKYETRQTWNYFKSNNKYDDKCRRPVYKCDKPVYHNILINFSEKKIFLLWPEMHKKNIKYFLNFYRGWYGLRQIYDKEFFMLSFLGFEHEIQFIALDILYERRDQYIAFKV